MDLKQLRALIAVTETGSITKAAAVLHVVQPAISRQIKLLEEELGQPLFERERHGMVLTPAGRRFVERARNALQELDKAREELSPARTQITGSVVAGFLPSSAELLASRLMGRLRELHPMLKLRSFITYVEDLEARLTSGEVDLALVYQREATQQFPSEPLLDEFLYLVGPPDAALDMSTPVTLSALQGLALVLPEPQHGLRRLIDRECASADVRFSVAGETNSMSVQKTLAMQGHGLTVLPGCAIKDEVLRGVLSAAPIAAPTLKRCILLVRSPARAATPAVQVTMQALRETVRDAVSEGGWPGTQLLN